MTERVAHVVVGGASGIGAAVVAAERASGTDVVVWDVAYVLVLSAALLAWARISVRNRLMS